VSIFLLTRQKTGLINELQGTYMPRMIFIALMILLTTSPVLGASGTGDQVGKMQITVDTKKTYQKIDHFGASAAWWAQDIGNWPVASRDAILDLLFDRQKGIGLNLVRYNIGGGKLQAKIADPWRSAESPYRPDGSLDWDRDQAAMSIIDGAVKRGAGVILFANSPPAELTVSGSPTGKGPVCNLRPDAREAFSVFLADCVNALAKRWPLVAISPINEPQWDWQPSKGQEGCYYSPADAVSLVETLVRVFGERRINLPISVIDSAEWSLAKNKSFLEALLANPSIRQSMGHYAVHSYWSVGEDREDLAAWLKQKAPDLAIWQTEWTEMRNEKDAGMQGALALANTVHEDFCLGKASSWQYWIALSKYRFSDGLIYVDTQARTYETTKRLYALGNWSRFIRPGALRVECETDPEARLRSSAFRNPDGSLVLVVINGDNEASPAIQLSLPDGLSGGKRLRIWETSTRANLEEIPVTGIQAISFPPESVTTLVVE
jgi:O-glycosyl hydrolase